MIATFRSHRSGLSKAAFTAVSLAALAFLASVIIGGADPSLTAITTAAGGTGLIMVISHWLYRTTQQSLAFQH